MKRIAALTSVRNDPGFLTRWIAHYGAAFGPESLYVIIDGMDQPVPHADTGVNVIRVPFVQRPLVAGDKARAARATALARMLFGNYDIVIGTDVDEFLVLDPKVDQDLHGYLADHPFKGSLSPLGLDVARHMTDEAPLDPARPVLDQRSYAKVSDRYTKSVILNLPLTWGSGYHRVRGRNFHIDPNLYLFHFGSVDPTVSTARDADTDRKAEGWGAHQARRNALFDEITSATPLEGDDRFASARAEMSLRRPLHAWNKPGRLRQDAIIRIPERFRGLV